VVDNCQAKHTLQSYTPHNILPLLHEAVYNRSAKVWFNSSNVHSVLYLFLVPKIVYKRCNKPVIVLHVCPISRLLLSLLLHPLGEEPVNQAAAVSSTMGFTALVVESQGKYSTWLWCAVYTIWPTNTKQQKGKRKNKRKKTNKQKK